MEQSMQNFLNEYDLVIQNAQVYTMDEAYTIYPKVTLAIEGDTIAWIGCPESPIFGKTTIDAEGQIITPGLIDCHTHLVYAGNRAQEFSKRLSGVSYAEIANAGGGIHKTVSDCRAASEIELMDSSRNRLISMMNQGCTTVEIKSGYGLDFSHEAKLLRAIRHLGKEYSIDVISTYLGLHAIPKEYAKDSDKYVQEVVHHILPKLAAEKLMSGVDAFCEYIAFSPKQIEYFFKAATEYQLNLHLHTEQLSHQGGAELAATYKACSVDHLEYLTNTDISYLAESGSVAVLLPGAFYQLQEIKKPPVISLRAQNIPMAIATDCNPGTSPFTSLPLMMNMACVLFGLDLSEAWLGVTRYAAKALKLDHNLGSIEIGKRANLVLWATRELEDIVYMPTINFCKTVIYSGKIRPSLHFY